MTEKLAVPSNPSFANCRSFCWNIKNMKTWKKTAFLFPGNKVLEVQILEPQSPALYIVIVLSCPLIGSRSSSTANQRVDQNNCQTLGSQDLYFLKIFTCEALHFKNNFFCAWNYTTSNKSKMRSLHHINYEPHWSLEPVYLSSEKPIFYMKAIFKSWFLAKFGFMWNLQWIFKSNKKKVKNIFAIFKGEQISKGILIFETSSKKTHKNPCPSTFSVW